MIADALRRQADRFVDLADLQQTIGREQPSVRESRVGKSKMLSSRDRWAEGKLFGEQCPFDRRFTRNHSPESNHPRSVVEFFQRFDLVAAIVDQLTV